MRLGPIQSLEVASMNHCLEVASRLGQIQSLEMLSMRLEAIQRLEQIQSLDLVADWHRYHRGYIRVQR